MLGGLCVCGDGWGGGGGMVWEGGGLGDNFIILVRASQYFKTYPIHIPGLWKKTDPFIY